MYYYLYLNIRNLLGHHNAIFNEDIGVRRRMIRNMRREYIKNIIMKLREYE
jgi:hypothetical protein